MTQMHYFQFLLEHLGKQQRFWESQVLGPYAYEGDPEELPGSWRCCSHLWSKPAGGKSLCLSNPAFQMKLFIKDSIITLLLSCTCTSY